ncbi:LOW QUALITY PROTEIN: WD repeat-containing protein 62-like [Bombina bombina]|uniref:LOW QUALITY PROTEIN: WD repeat-containing protein 62-like n=1 Tax=Bombina bombina TaxID=8345 RepID=UPI00235B165F|nr:LOW QUALITY PROTEIN: WD repeat-containing protein 62-like [Bombina bombina]
MKKMVGLEKVLGITLPSNSTITCDPNTGLLAYSAGCVIVLLCPELNKQTHIFNTSSKTLSALSFSPDGRYIAAGESGHNPAVRVWDVAEKVVISELLGHKYGVSCVRFSSDMKYVVSVGYQHDMVINVWDWKANKVVAKNKVSSKVTGLCFSEDNSYFVTVGNRHVKFWYMETPPKNEVNRTVPLVGRSGLLGDLRDNLICGVACGKGRNARSTFCISISGILCLFNARRVLEKWIKLKVSTSNCLCVTEQFVFCGCADGTVRIFNADNLQYITDLPKPHYLGVNLTQGYDPSMLFAKQNDSGYPDTIALVFDEYNQSVCCVYNDHSLYVWDVNDPRKVGKVYSALYHNLCVWNIEIFPMVKDNRLPPTGSFLTCSSDNTIRLWKTTSSQCIRANIYSNDLHKVIYVNENTQRLKDNFGTCEKDAKDSKNGVRVVTVSPGGQHLASGDRAGNIRIYDLLTFDELLVIEAHDGEILCLEYSKPLTGVTMLASASRDRLIHILDADNNYSVMQSLDDHSSSISSVKFAGDVEQMHLISCGVDKSIYFRTAQKHEEGIQFLRMHHVVEKTTLYDMDVDVTQKTVAVACQDKTIRLYNNLNGKLEKSFKNSASGGALLKVQIDPSGTFYATSCANKNICIYDLQSGECLATVYGHSDLVTDMKFTYDCKQLITVSGDSCVFIWQLDPEMTACMQQRLKDITSLENPEIPCEDGSPINICGNTFLVKFLEDLNLSTCTVESAEQSTPLRDSFEAEDAPLLQTNGKMPLWVKKLEQGKEYIPTSKTPYTYQPRGRWAKSDNLNIVKILESKFQNDYNSPSSDKSETSLTEDQLECMEPKNLQHLLESEERNPEDFAITAFTDENALALEDSDDNFRYSGSNIIYYPMPSHQDDSDFAVEEQISSESYRIISSRNTSNLSLSSQQYRDDESQSSVESNSVDEDQLQTISHTPEEENCLLNKFDIFIDLADEKFDNCLKDLNPLEDDENDLNTNPRLSISSRYLSRYQNNDRFVSSSVPPEPLVPPSTDSPAENAQEKISTLKKPTQKSADELIPEGPEKKRSSKRDVKGSSKTASSRMSYPGCWPTKTKEQSTNRRQSYMDHTASSKAKVQRSVSVGENINCVGGEDHSQAKMDRSVSSIDLYSLGSSKSLETEKQSSVMCSGNKESRRATSVTSSTASDRLLMPPPSACGVLPRLKRKARSMTNLDKNNQTSNSTHTIDIPLQKRDWEDQYDAVLLGKFKTTLEELQSTFQTALKIYNEIELCGSSQRRVQVKSLLSEALDHVQTVTDLMTS